MEWNRFQVPHSQSHQPRPARPQYWGYDTEDVDTRELQQRDVTPFAERFVTPPPSTAMPPPFTMPFKSESDTLESNDSGMLLQPMNSMMVPQVEEDAEFQHFFSPHQTPFEESTCLSPIQQPQQMQQPRQLTSFAPPPLPSPQLSQLPPPMGNGYPSLPSQEPSYVDDTPNAAMGSALPNIGSPLPMTPLRVAAALRTPMTMAMGNFPTRSIPSISIPPPLGFAGVAGSGDSKRELIEPFAAMPTVPEPKFSPDRRKLCCVEGCKSQARAFNRCKRHGGSKRCSHPGCTKSVQSRGLCIRHGGGARCTEPECSRASQSHGKCKMHGGGRPCMVVGCEKKAHLKRLCRKHGGGAKCSAPGCDKWAQRQGKCMTHSKMANPSTAESGAGPGPSRKPPPPTSSPFLTATLFDDNMPM